MKTENKNITVAVGMSGGVDSSVAAALLVQEGYNVFGITMKTYDYMEVGGSLPNESSCCDLHAVMDAHTVTEKLGVPHYVVNVREEFGDAVINNFVERNLLRPGIMPVSGSTRNDRDTFFPEANIKRRINLMHCGRSRRRHSAKHYFLLEK
jgi:NH3-dependent NAD+ synthetase